jgi:hypothetical protein
VAVAAVGAAVLAAAPGAAAPGASAAEPVVVAGPGLAPAPQFSGVQAAAFPTKKLWVDTFADAPGMFPEKVGVLKAGRNYVFCRSWGEEVRQGNQYNHWWMWTTLDQPKGKQAWVSAFYLSRWGNDEAKDNDGKDLPLCY